MRFGLILLLLGLPGAALAAEDRYGPSRSRDPVAGPVPVSAVAPALAGRGPSDYRGRLLNWLGKAAPAVQAVTTSSAPSIASPPPQAFASRGPEPARLPTSLYDAPAPVAAAPVAQPPAPPPRAAWPQAAEPGPPTPPSAPPAAGSATYGYSPPRAYSVVREWGGTPDRIPSPPKAGTYGGREVALDPNTLGAAQPQDPPPEDEIDEEEPQRKTAKPATKARK